MVWTVLPLSFVFHFSLHLPLPRHLTLPSGPISSRFQRRTPSSKRKTQFFSVATKGPCQLSRSQPTALPAPNWQPQEEVPAGRAGLAAAREHLGRGWRPNGRERCGGGALASSRPPPVGDSTPGTCGQRCAAWGRARRRGRQVGQVCSAPPRPQSAQYFGELASSARQHLAAVLPTRTRASQASRPRPASGLPAPRSLRVPRPFPRAPSPPRAPLDDARAVWRAPRSPRSGSCSRRPPWRWPWLRKVRSRVVGLAGSGTSLGIRDRDGGQGTAGHAFPSGADRAGLTQPRPSARGRRREGSRSHGREGAVSLRRCAPLSRIMAPSRGGGQAGNRAAKSGDFSASEWARGARAARGGAGAARRLSAPTSSGPGARLAGS